ncbi:unnamed protein product [Oppiella nova]|uniref:Uncharacterized protein n=1 Tax=Oppiella nova TaxID=334625 RepID=A0A7R9LCW4_9ACAR|nr:unnamed protein product [Oppiella nova]CAG2161534.1 unnamed protein product [Oppiella nova]
MFTKCIAVELGHKGIRVNSVNPGAVKTDIGRDDTVGQSGVIPWYEKFGKLYPVGRHGVGDDIANAVLYLASNESSFITGSVLVADGGHLAANMSLTHNFVGKVALVTGSSSGIGAATAILFAKSGANVVVTGRNATKVSEVAKQCLNVSPKGLKALEVVADVTRDEDLVRLVDTTVQTFSKIDILVNNVGTDESAPIWSTDYMDIFKKTCKINLDSVVFLTHICVKHLEKTKGNIVNISAVSSTQTLPQYSAYCMSKSALDMFTKCIAVELGHKGIRVNSVNPGAVDTITKDLTHDYDVYNVNIYAKLYPVGRYGVPQDIANTVLYLASNESSFITGTGLVSDGGHLAANVNISQLQ